MAVTIGASTTTRTWSWTYDAFGRVLTATDARGFTSTNTYYPNTAGQGFNRGLLATVTNAAGHTTTITSYNAHGQQHGHYDRYRRAVSLRCGGQSRWR